MGLVITFTTQVAKGVNMINVIHETWWTILKDPNHLIAEGIVSFVEEVLVFVVGYYLGRKRIWQKIHDRFDREHDIEH